MTSKERVLAAIRHGQPDRVPVDLGLASELAAAVCGRIGLPEHELAGWLGQDITRLSPSYPDAVSDKQYADPTVEVTPDGLYLDVFRVPFRETQTEFQTYMELAGQPPLAACETIEDLAAFPWPRADAWDYSLIPAQLQANADKATIGHSRGFFEIAHFMRGMDTFLMDLALNPELACALMDHIAEYLLDRAGRILDAGDGAFTIFEYNDDVASQRGLFISPDMWRRYVKPRMSRFCDLIHSHGAKVRYHSCGSVREIIPDLIDVGVDVLNPVQPLATGMDPFELKREFGDALTFHGGIDIQDLLPNASADEVCRHVRRIIDEVGRDGGYILGGSHTLQADTPVENVVAMVEEARR